jgi:hypothetical protein
LNAVNGDWSRQLGEMRLPIDIPDAVVESGHACSLTIDATSLTPATLRGRITIDGSPPALARVELIEDRHWAFGQFTPAADGTFEAAGIIPGTYHLQLITGDVRVVEGSRILHEDALTLAPGQSLVHDFAFVHRRLSIQIVQADGTTPAARLQVCCEGAGLELTINADQDGRFVLDPAPSGPIRLLNARERGALIGTVEIPAGATEHEVKVTLPPSAKK